MSNEEKLNHYIDRLNKSDERSLILKKHCARLVSKSDNNDLLQAMKAARIMKARSEKVSPDPMFVNQLEHALLSAKHESTAALWVLVIPALATIAVFVVAFLPGEPTNTSFESFASIELPVADGVNEQDSQPHAETQPSRTTTASSKTPAYTSTSSSLPSSSVTPDTSVPHEYIAPPSDNFDEMVHQVNLASF